MNKNEKTAAEYHQVLTRTNAQVSVQCFDDRKAAVRCWETLTAVGAKPTQTVRPTSIDGTYAALRSMPLYANRDWSFTLPTGEVIKF